MKLKALLEADDAVSPVIGVILMVAITVILAAVIATFVLGLGEQVGTTTPTASFATSYTQLSDTTGNLTITHNSGDVIKANALWIRGRNGSNGGVPNTFNNQWVDFATDSITNLDSAGSNSTSIGNAPAVAAGDFVRFGIGSDARINVVYQAPGGDSTATLATFSGPAA